MSSHEATFIDKFILVVEDDPMFRKLLVKALERRSYKCREAENARVAITIFDLARENVGLIISDINMPEADGIDLLKHVRSVSNLPFILMTGFAEILEMHDAHSLGADEFIAKPFQTEALYEAIDNCLSPSTVQRTLNDEGKETQQQFCPIPIADFLMTSTLRTDVYVKLSDKKFVKVARKDETVSLERLKIYQEKKVDFLFVTVVDFATYVDFNLTVTSLAVRDKRIPRDRKLKLLRHATETLLEKCFLSEIDPSITQPAQKMVEDTLALVTEDDALFDTFANVESHSDRLYSHSVAVAVYSCMVAREHGWTSVGTLFKTALAGLFHDIGLKEIDPAIVGKRRMLRTPEESKSFESHPVRGRDLIFGLRSLPEDVGLICAQHHEGPNGTGYPAQLSGEGIHPLARLVATVDRFVETVIPLEIEVDALRPKAALKRLWRANAQDIDRTFFRRLCTLFNLSDDDLNEAKKAI